MNILSFIIKIYVDETTNGKMNRMKGICSLKKDKDFSGYVIFHDLDGSFANGWKFECGKPTHTVVLTSGKILDLNLKSASCTTYDIYNWTTVCTDYYTIGWVDGEMVSYSYTGSSCSSYQVYAGSYSVCNYTSGGTGGGGYSSSTTSAPCNCQCMCPNCGGCLDGILKSGGTNSCMVCTCGFDIDIDGYDQLNESEKKLVKFYPMEAIRISLNRDLATKATIELFGYNGHNDKADAFRHAYFQALNCSMIGFSLAKLFGDAHEEAPDQPSIEKAMDLYNNDVGYEIGRNSYNIRRDVLNALNSGKLKYINSNNVLTPTNQ